MTCKDMTGQRFSWLVVKKREGTAPKGHTTWLCLCDCGNTRIVQRRYLVEGKTRSCGCQDLRPPRRAHGLSSHSAYISWKKLVSRCTKPSDPVWALYGGRGITVCERWLKVENFIEDMGERPKGMTIERVDNNKGYSPENCKWASMKEQGRNKRNNRILTFQGRAMCVVDWEMFLGFPPNAVAKRLHAGWDDERALTTPLRIR